MSTMPLPTKPGNDHHVHNRKPQRSLRPSGPGVRWMITPDKAVRFSKQLDRVHWDAGSRRNVITFLPHDGAQARPSDKALFALLAMCSRPARPGLSGHREWTFRQAATGEWYLTLNLRGGDKGRMSFPAPDSKTRFAGREIALTDDSSIALAAKSLWDAADMAEQGVTSTSALTQQLMEVFS